MTLNQIKKSYKAHYYFCRQALFQSYKLFKVSLAFNTIDSDRELRREINRLSIELQKKIREYYGPKIGVASIEEIENETT